MSPRYRRKTGQRIGPWTLQRPLGAGGNGEVWEATRSEEDRTLAVKILHVTSADAEPYKRFRDEVAVLDTLGGLRGILPLSDSHLPTSPTRQNPAWLATPVATPVRTACSELSGAERTRAIISGIANFATTLSTLHERGISHRDIKPNNLYVYKEEWVLGDFGLVRYPGKEDITADGRKLGPTWFLAPEMLNKPADTDGQPADVYSLAKSAWVLIAGDDYPQPGQLGRLGWLQSAELTELLSSATHPRVESRPDMFQFAAEMRILANPNEPTPADTQSERAELVMVSLRDRLEKLVGDLQEAIPASGIVAEKPELNSPSIEDLLDYGRLVSDLEEPVSHLLPRADMRGSHGYRHHAPLWCRILSLQVRGPAARVLLVIAAAIFAQEDHVVFGGRPTRLEPIPHVDSQRIRPRLLFVGAGRWVEDQWQPEKRRHSRLVLGDDMLANRFARETINSLDDGLVALLAGA